MSLADCPVCVFGYYFILYLSRFVQKLVLVFTEITVCVLMVRQIGFPLHFISMAHCCPPVLILDITLMWQDACHIGKYYIIKCCKMLVIYTDIITGIRSFLRKWDNTVIPLTDNEFSNLWLHTCPSTYTFQPHSEVRNHVVSLLFRNSNLYVRLLGIVTDLQHIWMATLTEEILLLQLYW